MLNDRNSQAGISEFMRYLAAHPEAENSLPSLTELSLELGISVATLREQLEVARALGLVDVRPRTGIRRLPYTFLPTIRKSLGYAMNLDTSYFMAFSDLRRHLEAAYWHEAVQKLSEEDQQFLQGLVERAIAKLHGTPIQIPHEEHKQLHLTIFRHIDNLFVSSILEAYWEAYEAIGLNVYNDINYLQEVWQYHHQMVEAIVNKKYDEGYTALVKHTDLIYHLYKRPAK
ncbi:MAG: FCD domain-containing protein [Anaerolineales bacterium]|jgi:DNA-binding FadR family transcriptional regulator|nr:FCD domain-containing protein [Anaerolineales bacterium]